jgi:hypothetical protein
MIFITNGYSQDINTPINTDHKKGEFFFAWGYNWSWYSNSDIKFEGENYNFELKSVEATDRQTPFTFEKYFRFNSITIPQYNLRLGYYFKTNYSVSIGIDHMKYVARSGQAVKISGIIENSGTIYDGVYNNKTVLLEEFFLEFEHTDGLNYINAEIRRFDDLFALHKSIKMNLFYGTGIGFIYPKTNSLLLNNDRYDQFNLAGYGLHALFGVGFTFFKHLIIKTELKGGYVNMSNIRTTLNKSDSASQSFFFGQYNFSLGGSFNLCENKQKKKR